MKQQGAKTVVREKYDVIIVLARGIQEDGTLPADPLARVRKAVELYKEKEALHIVMSGSWTYHLDTNPPHTEAAAMKEYAVELGVPERAITEETKSKDTLGNAYFTKLDLCLPRKWSKIIVVTSEDHLERSQYIFHKVFGPNYSIRFETSERVISEEEYIKELRHEVKSLHILKQWTEPIANGDDKAIWKLMAAKHPAYSANPEVSREQLLRALNDDKYPESS